MKHNLKEIQMMQNIFSGHNRIKLKINTKDRWKISKTLKIEQQIYKYHIGYLGPV